MGNSKSRVLVGSVHERLIYKIIAFMNVSPMIASSDHQYNQIANLIADKTEKEITLLKKAVDVFIEIDECGEVLLLGNILNVILLNGVIKCHTIDGQKLEVKIHTDADGIWSVGSGLCERKDIVPKLKELSYGVMKNGWSIHYFHTSLHDGKKRFTLRNEEGQDITNHIGITRLFTYREAFNMCSYCPRK